MSNLKSRWPVLDRDGTHAATAFRAWASDLTSSNVAWRAELGVARD